MKNGEHFLIYASDKSGKHCLGKLQQSGKNYTALAVCPQQKDKLMDEGTKSVFRIDLERNQVLEQTDVTFSRCLIFSDDIPECTKLIPFVRRHFKIPVCVITHEDRPMLISIYKQLGASLVLQTISSDLSFLV